MASLTLYVCIKTDGVYSPECGKSFQSEAACQAHVAHLNRIEAIRRLCVAAGVPASLCNGPLLGSIAQELALTEEAITAETGTDFAYTTTVITPPTP